MKATLQFEQKNTPFGYKETKLARIKILDENGKYIKFAKHTPEVIQYLESVEIEIPYNLQNIITK